MTRCALYRHFDADDQLLYVGISIRPGARLSEHLAGSHWADQIANVSLEWFDDIVSAFNAERAAILGEGPLHNRVGAINADAAHPITAQRVRSLRAASEMTQADFAELIGASRAQLGNWETGMGRLSLNGALALREAFGVSLDWLYPEALS